MIASATAAISLRGLMDPVFRSSLVPWENVYVIIGSSGAALTGLQFVVIALIADSRRQSTSREIAAFGTPTILHFCSGLLVSCLMSAPWTTASGLAWALGACGTAGFVYSLIVVRRAMRQTSYELQLEDWVWHAALPICTYGALAIAGLMLQRSTASALFAVAAATLLLIFIGVHNAWDTVTYVALDLPSKTDAGGVGRHQRR